MKKYIILGLKNTIIGIAYFFSQVLMLQFIRPAETWIVLPNGITFSNLVLIILGCVIFAFGAANLFFGSIFLNLFRSDEIKEHIYKHGEAVFGWTVKLSGILLLGYLLLIMTSVLYFNPNGVKAFAYYGEAFEPFMCALMGWSCPK